MRRLLIPLLLLVTCAGCYRFAGPLAVRQMGPADGRAPDGSRYTIYEQERRGRARLAITEDDRSVGPNAYIDRPSPIGR
jgi:hypothetical protein